MTDRDHDQLGSSRTRWLPRANEPGRILPQGFAWPTISFLATLLVALGAVGGAVWLILILENRGLVRDDFVLPILLVAAVLGLLASLAGLIPMFHRAALTNDAEALGLPAGSVRALIALSFIVMFLIMAVFLQVRAGVQESGRVEGVSVEEFERMLSDPAVIVLSATVEQSNPLVRSVVLGRLPTEAESRFADRMFSTVSTIVVALSAFYFGTRSVTAARRALGGDASVTVSSPGTDEAFLPDPDRPLTIRIATHPTDAAVRGQATAGELVRLEGQAGVFRFSAPADVAEAVLTFDLPDHPGAERATLVLGRRPADDATAPAADGDVDEFEDEQAWAPAPDEAGAWDAEEAHWIQRISEIQEPEEPV